MTKQKHIKAIDASSKAEELLPLEQLMSQGSASNEGATHAVDETNQVKDSEHQGTEGSSLVPKLRFAGFVSNWQQISLKDVSSVIEYGLHAPAISYDFANKYLRITDIDGLTRGFSKDNLTSPGCNLSSVDKRRYCAIEGDIFFAETGNTVGRSCLYDINDGLVYYSWHLIRAHIKESTKAEFVFFCTQTARYEYFVVTTSSRSAQPGISALEYGTFQFYAPYDIDEQQRIGALFKELDHNIKLNRGLLEKLTQLKKSMLEQMFPREGESVPRLRFAGFTEPWRSVYLKDVVTSFDYGLNASAKDYDFCTKYLRITDIDEDSRKFLTTDLKSPDVEAVKASNYLAQDGDLFFARTASVGRTYLYSKSDGRVVFAGYLIRGHGFLQYSNNAV